MFACWAAVITTSLAYLPDTGYFHVLKLPRKDVRVIVISLLGSSGR